MQIFYCIVALEDYRHYLLPNILNNGKYEYYELYLNLQAGLVL